MDMGLVERLRLSYACSGGFAENVHLPALYVDLLYTTPQALLASLAPGDRLAHVFSTLVMISKTCRVWKFVCKVKSTAKTL